MPQITGNNASQGCKLEPQHARQHDACTKLHLLGLLLLMCTRVAHVEQLDVTGVGELRLQDERGQVAAEGGGRARGHEGHTYMVEEGIWLTCALTRPPLPVFGCSTTTIGGRHRLVPERLGRDSCRGVRVLRRVRAADALVGAPRFEFERHEVIPAETVT